jgi:hypothetical protein
MNFTGNRKQMTEILQKTGSRHQELVVCHLKSDEFLLSAPCSLLNLSKGDVL